jgi:acyl-CoA thioesterase I
LKANVKISPVYFIAFLATVLVTSLSAAEPRTVIIFGDSITQGGALPADQRDQAWVTLIQKQTVGQLKLVNEGKGGRPTDSVKEFDAMLLKHPRADQLVIALGTNDSRDITDQCRRTSTKPPWAPRSPSPTSAKAS